MYRWKVASSVSNKNVKMAAFVKIQAKSSNANVPTGLRMRSAQPTSTNARATAASTGSVSMELLITPVPACQAGPDGCKCTVVLIIYSM